MKLTASRDQTAFRKTTSVVSLGIAFVFALFSTPSAHATEPTRMGSFAAPSGGTKKPGMQTEASCGMACRYHRANDNLTVQALYLVTKLQKVEEAHQAGGRDDEIRAAIGPICRSGMSVGDCVKDFKAFQALALIKIRQSMGKNESTMVDLTHGRKADGKVEGDFIGFATGEEADPYTPDVPTFGELQAEFDRMKTEGKVKDQYSEHDVKRWAQSLIINNPKERLIQFDKKTVEGNPHTNRGETAAGYRLTRSVKDGVGTEADADQDERLIYEKNAAQLKGIATLPLSGNGNPQKFLTPKDIQGKPIRGRGGYDSKDAISYEAFTEARSRIIDKVNQDTKKDGPRKPAGKSAPAKDAQKDDPEKKDEKDPKTAGFDPKKLPGANGRSIDSEKNVDVKTRTQQGYQTYEDHVKVTRPPGSKNSRYIRYDVQELLKDIGDTTK